MNNGNHKVEYWDSRLSGKKKLAVDGTVLTLTTDQEIFSYNFKCGDYIFIVSQNEDEKPRLTINNRDFNDLLQDERTGKLQKDRQQYNKNKSRKNNPQSDSEYYKRALKYNGDNFVEGTDGEIYDIEEQRKRLEEFERKKQKENEEKNKKSKNNKNQMIIKNINNIFDDENLLDLNEINFNQDDNNNKGNNNNYYNFGQMNNNMNNNENNQEVINKFLSNMENNNNNYNINNGYNINETNNYMNQNNPYNQNQNINNNNNYDDDFNPFDD